jgi:hypothetical protein
MRGCAKNRGTAGLKRYKTVRHQSSSSGARRRGRPDNSHLCPHAPLAVVHPSAMASHPSPQAASSRQPGPPFSLLSAKRTRLPDPRSG